MSQQLKTALVKRDSPDGLFKMSNQKPIREFDVSDAQLVSSNDSVVISSQETTRNLVIISLLKMIFDTGGEDFKTLEQILAMLHIRGIIPEWASRRNILDCVKELSLSLPKSLTYNVPKERYSDEYEEIEQLGQGGFGCVYKVCNKIDGKYYAIKKIKIPCSTDCHTKVINEVKILAGLGSPFIVRYYTAWIGPSTAAPGSSVFEINTARKNILRGDYIIANTDDCLSAGEKVVELNSDETDERYSLSDNNASSQEGFSRWQNSTTESDDEFNAENRFIASPTSTLDITNFASENQKVSTLFIQMELCKETLKEWLERRNSPEPSNGKKSALEIVNNSRNWIIFQELLKGVIYLHNAEIIHRDLKPGNIFLTDTMQVKIGDFGLATNRRQTERKTSSKGNDPELLSVGVGTRMYAAPEQKETCNYDNKADIYSLGLIAYEMYYVFNSESEKVKLFGDLKEKRKVSDFIMENFPEIGNLILAMTDLDPSRRPTAEDLLKQVQPPSIEEIIKDYERILAEKDAEIKRLKYENQHCQC